MRTRVVARTGAAASAAPADDFTAFVQQWTPPVVKALSATLGDPDLARDATQEALTRAWLRWPDVLSLANPPGWLYRVGLNWARSRYRRMRREVLGGHIERPQPTGEVPDPMLAAALQRLPVTHRAVLVLRFYMDWKAEDVAAALAIPVGTVRSRQHHAIKRLRKEFGDDS